MENGHKEGDPLGSSPWTELMVVKGKAGQCPGRRGQVRDVVGGGASRINIRQKQETQLPGSLAGCGRQLGDSTGQYKWMFQDSDRELAGKDLL